MKLKSDEYKNFSKADVIRIIREYLKQNKGICQKENLDKHDFESPGWALRQAHANGMIKMINKLENFLPEE